LKTDYGRCDLVDIAASAQVAAAASVSFEAIGSAEDSVDGFGQTKWVFSYHLSFLLLLQLLMYLS
jgi:hypothetical protein